MIFSKKKSFPGQFIFCTAIMVCVSVYFSRAQSGADFYEFEFRTGYLVKNYFSIPETKGPSNMASMRFGKRLNGFRLWHRYYNFPYIGVDITGGYLANKYVHGAIFGVSPEMMFTQKLGTRFYLAEILGIGLAWFNHPYDVNRNAENTYIGSRITALPHASIGLEYYVTPFWSLWLRASAYHASNCHYQLPNIGINMASASLAVRYHPHPAMVTNTTNTGYKTDKKIHFNTRFGFGLNERGKSTGPVGGPKRVTYISQLYLTKNISSISKLQGGLELDYSTGIYDTISQGEFYQKNQKLKSSMAILFLGHEFLLGHFSLSVQSGVYLYNPFQRELARRENLTGTKEKLKTIIIGRLGFQYYLKNIVVFHSNQLYFGIYVKTNLGQADYLDLGVGYTF